MQTTSESPKVLTVIPGAERKKAQAERMERSAQTPVIRAPVPGASVPKPMIGR